ncbi:putative transmembrane ascorbate ferrireductase 2 [Vitis vinifera]|uniref:Putative transmembrane ascorbate ferrireductase 2 n=1 Tax=Vitis vinifera TaxID=29760 RepID=A0A438HXV2_VITVI|nr:putative transmembrane ascorbate ferrireductase 2 [Vitis vinifera]
MAGRGSSFRITLTLVTLSAHLLLIAVTTLVLVWLLHFRGGLAFKSDNKEKIFNVHPLLMIVGFIMIGGEGSSGKKKGTDTGSPDIAFYRSCGWNLRGKAVGFLLMNLKWMFAFFSFWYPGVKKPRRRRLMPWHWYAGMVIFLMAILTAETGLVQRSTYLRRQEALIVNFTGLLILLFATAVGLSVIHPSCLPPKSGSDPVISFPELVIGLADVVLTSNDS